MDWEDFFRLVYLVLKIIEKVWGLLAKLVSRRRPPNRKFPSPKTCKPSPLG